MWAKLPARIRAEWEGLTGRLLGKDLNDTVAPLGQRNPFLGLIVFFPLSGGKGAGTVKGSIPQKAPGGTKAKAVPPPTTKTPDAGTSARETTAISLEIPKVTGTIYFLFLHLG